MDAGNFLTAKDRRVGDRLKVLVTGEGKIQPAEGEFKASVILDVKHENKPMSMRLGVKNVKAISDRHGRDTKSWVGKELEFIVYMTNYQNKLGFQFVG
jgi:glutamine synthetase